MESYYRADPMLHMERRTLLATALMSLSYVQDLVTHQGLGGSSPPAEQVQRSLNCCEPAVQTA